jgi:hypothetical protein
VDGTCFPPSGVVVFFPLVAEHQGHHNLLWHRCSNAPCNTVVPQNESLFTQIQIE